MHTQGVVVPWPTIHGAGHEAAELVRAWLERGIEALRLTGRHVLNVPRHVLEVVLFFDVLPGFFCLNHLLEARLVLWIDPQLVLVGRALVGKDEVNLAGRHRNLVRRKGKVSTAHVDGGDRRRAPIAGREQNGGGCDERYRQHGGAASPRAARDAIHERISPPHEDRESCEKCAPISTLEQRFDIGTTPTRPLLLDSHELPRWLVPP